MIRKTIKSILLVFACSLLLGMLTQESVQAAKKASLSSTKLNVEVGKTKTLKIKNVSKKVTWKVVSGKNKIGMTKKGKKAVTIKGKSAGTAKVQASFGGKKLSCAITVKKSEEKTPEKEDTKEPENIANSAEEDVAALKKLIAEQKEAGADVSSGMGSSQYTWNSEGRLVGINWKHCNLRGTISFAAFPCLEELDCSDNRYYSNDEDEDDDEDEYKDRRYLRGIDISKNAALKILKCSNNVFDSFDISNNTKLEVLDCTDSGIDGLDISNNVALKTLKCSGIGLYHLDISPNTELKELDCSHNALSNLDISANTELKELDCSYNKFSNLDISPNKELEILNCSENYLASLEVKTNNKLRELYVRSQMYDDSGDVECYVLNTLILDSVMSLEILDCRYNPNLSEINLSNTPVLKSLKVTSTGIKELDVSNHPLLTELEAYNSVQVLNASNNPCLTELNLSENSCLQLLNVSNTPLVDVELSAEVEDTVILIGCDRSIVSWWMVLA